MDYMKAKRELANKEAAIAARLEAERMVAREKQRGQAAPSVELNQNSIDIERIAYIAVRQIDDGFKSDVYVLPEDPHAPLIAVPCSFDTKDATAHYNEEGKGFVDLTYSDAARLAVNIKTVSRLQMTPGAITNALAHWKTSDAPYGVPVRLSDEQIHEIQTQLAIAELRAMAEKGIIDRRAPSAAKHQLAS